MRSVNSTSKPSQIQCIVPTALILPKPAPSFSWTAVTGRFIASTPSAYMYVIHSLLTTKEICFFKLYPRLYKAPLFKTLPSRMTEDLHRLQGSTTAWWIPVLPFPRLQCSLNSCFRGFAYLYLPGLSSFRSTQSWSHLFT